MIAPIRDWIAADNACNLLLRLNGMLRVFLNEIPQDIPQVKDGYPAVVYTMIAGVPNNYLDGPPSIDYLRWQFDAYAPTEQGANAIYTVVRDVLEHHGYTSINFTDRDRDTRNWRVSFDFTCWQDR